MNWKDLFIAVREGDGTTLENNRHGIIDLAARYHLLIPPMLVPLVIPAKVRWRKRRSALTLIFYKVAVATSGNQENNIITYLPG